MRLGVALPTNRELLDAGELGATLDAFEQADVASVWVNDHLASFPAGTERYPYSADGRIDWDPAVPQYEALTTCAFVAARTTRMRVGTAVLVLPQRHPLEVAKAVVTVSTLSAGRFVLGVGAGWSTREMSALGRDPRTRGARLEDGLRLMTALWTGGRPVPSAYHELPPDLVFRPVLPERDRPAVLVGGTSAAALRRVVRLGTGWIGVSDDSPAGMADQAERLTWLRATAARRPLAVLKIALPDPDPDRAGSAARRAAAAGWDEVCFEFRRWDHGDARAFARSGVLAPVRAGDP